MNFLRKAVFGKLSSFYPQTKSFISDSVLSYQHQSFNISKVWGLLGGYTAFQMINNFDYSAYCSDKDASEPEISEIQNATREEKLASLNKMTPYNAGRAEEYPEQVLVEITIQHQGQDVKLLVARVEGKLYCVGATDTYDPSINLADGKLFGDKLYSPIHGSAYNIKTGRVEYGPAYYDLAIFYIKESANGDVMIALPKFPPTKVKPLTAYRDYNDLRKILIIGSGAAALGTMHGLRQIGFTGEIRFVTKDTKLPFDKTKLSKSFKNMDYEKILFHNEDFYDEYSIEHMLGRRAVFINNKHKVDYVELEDGLRLEYDALILCTGQRPVVRQIEGYSNQENVYFLTDIEDHRNIRQKLETAKKVTILGANITSLETASTIRQEYPNLEVRVIDENQELDLDVKLGKKVTDRLLQLHKQNGVKFSLSQKIQEFQSKGDQVKKIKLESGKNYDTDMIIMFPNLKKPNLEYIDEGENIEKFEPDKEEGKLKVGFDQRAGHKRIFAAGDVTSTFEFRSLKRCFKESWAAAYHGGYNAAYNIMALDIPMTINEFQAFKMYNRYYNVIGSFSFYDSVHIDGDISNDDFIAYYGYGGNVMYAVASEKRKKDALVLNEAMRLNIMPRFNKLKDGKVDVNRIEQRIREENRSGCFRDLIYTKREYYVIKDLLWKDRTKSNEFQNFWEREYEDKEDEDEDSDD